MVKGVAEEIQVPTDLPGGLALAALATAAGGRAEVAVRGRWREPLNLQLGIAMPPGSGKSPAFRLMLAPVFAAETALQEAATRKIQEIQQDKQAALTRAEAARRAASTEDAITVAVDAARMAEEIDVPVKPRLTADDVVPEQAATILAEQGGRLAILSAEGSFFEIVMGRYSGRPNLELMLKGHAGDRLQVDRRGREEFVERPALTMGICLQPQLLQDIAATKQMAGRGALARLLLAIPPDLVGARDITGAEQLPDAVLHEYTDTVKALIVGLNEWTDPAVIGLTEAALTLHTQWRAEIEPRLAPGGEWEALREWASKLAGHTIRLAGLLHLAENPTRGAQTAIGEDTMRRAITLARYYAAHALAAWGVMHAHPLLDDARAVLAWIGKRTMFTQREVHRSLRRRLETADRVTSVLNLLEDHGYIRQTPTVSTGGRRPGIFSVNPQIR
jgi:hypothetical protein